LFATFSSVQSLKGYTNKFVSARDKHTGSGEVDLQQPSTNAGSIVSKANAIAALKLFIYRNRMLTGFIACGLSSTAIMGDKKKYHDFAS